MEYYHVEANLCLTELIRKLLLCRKYDDNERKNDKLTLKQYCYVKKDVYFLYLWIWYILDEISTVLITQMQRTWYFHVCSWAMAVHCRYPPLCPIIIVISISEGNIFYITNFQDPLGLFMPVILKKIGSLNFSCSYGGPHGHPEGLTGAHPFAPFLTVKLKINEGGRCLKQRSLGTLYTTLYTHTVMYFGHAAALRHSCILVLGQKTVLPCFGILT